LNLTLNVNSGWNLLSSTIGFQATTVFCDTQKFTSVWKWTVGGTGAKTWAVYLPGGDDGASYAQSKGFMPLTSIASGEGFWVNIKQVMQFTVSGVPVVGGLSLSKGWNLVGLQSTQPTTVDSITATQSGIVSLWKWENNNWSVSLPGESTPGAYGTSKGFGTLTTISPGEGFWVNVSN